MLPAGFEPEIPADEQAQTHALDSTTTGNACDSRLIVDIILRCVIPVVCWKTNGELISVRKTPAEKQ